MILSGPGSEASLLDLNGNGGWALVDDGGEWKNRERSAETGGPARQVLARPFLIVTATQGTPEAVQTLHDVAIYMSMGHAYASKTTSRIVNDTVMASELQSGGHLAEDYNLVVIGGPAYNKAASSLMSLSPMRGAKLNTGYGPGAPEGEHWLTLGPCKVELNIQIPLQLNIQISLHTEHCNFNDLHFASDTFSPTQIKSGPRIPSNLQPKPSGAWRGYCGAHNQSSASETRRARPRPAPSRGQHRGDIRLDSILFCGGPGPHQVPCIPSLGFRV